MDCSRCKLDISSFSWEVLKVGVLGRAGPAGPALAQLSLQATQRPAPNLNTVRASHMWICSVQIMTILTRIQTIQPTNFPTWFSLCKVQPTELFTRLGGLFIEARRWEDVSPTFQTSISFCSRNCLMKWFWSSKLSSVLIIVLVSWFGRPCPATCSGFTLTSQPFHFRISIN